MVSLNKLAGGAVQEQFEVAFHKALENLQNVNTPFKNTRKITIELKFTQNETRDDVKCAVSVTEKLAPQAPLETAFAIGTNLATNQAYANEYGRNIIYGQIDVDDFVPNIENIAAPVMDFRKTNKEEV